MFTGIINHTGTIKSIKKSGDWLFTVAVPDFTRGLAIGASVAHNGACLTVLSKDAESFTVQVSKETLDRTTLGSWKAGQEINLERALKVGDELGGHMVTGHVDGLAELVEKKAIGESFKLTFSVPRELAAFVAEKGSVTLDGISLTVNEVAQNSFCVNIIPHTMQSTTLGRRKAGDKLNFEIDIIARYLSRLKTYNL